MTWLSSEPPAIDVGPGVTIGKVLLATPVDPQSNGIGALFLRDLVASQADTNFAFHQEPSFLTGGRAISSPSLVRFLWAGSSRLPLFHSAKLRWFRSWQLETRTAAVTAAADAAQAESIWTTASSPEMIWIAERLAASGRDVRVTVWDAPEYLSGNLRLDAALCDILMESFASLLQRARAVSVIGQAMQDDYRQRYGIRSEIIRHGIDADLTMVGRKPNSKGPVRVIFAGSLYSKKEWNSFVEALEAANWQVAGRPVVLHFMGRFPLSDARKPAQVVMLGEKPFGEALRIMSSMDIGYLPYWFDKSHETVARTSFPGKLSAYAAAGLAVFHHAPSYTEATAFLQEYEFGLACPSLKPDDVIGTLNRLVELAAMEECRAARMKAVHNELSREAMAGRFRRFLGISPV